MNTTITAVSGLYRRSKRLTRRIALLSITTALVVAQPALAFAAQDKPKKPGIRNTKADFNFPVIGEIGREAIAGALAAMAIGGILLAIIGLSAGSWAIKNGKPAGKNFGGAGLGFACLGIALLGAGFFFGVGDWFSTVLDSI